MASSLSDGSLSAKAITIDPSLSIVYRDVSQLQLDPKNARVHSKKQIQQIAHSIEAFGFNAPILVNSELKVIAGHGRLAACKLLGITTVPTISLKHLTKEQVRAFAIADNRLGETAEWDDRLLAEELKALSELELEFSLDAIGFDTGEIDVMLDGLQKPVEKETTANAVPKITNLVPVTMPGDLWLLGKNRILCGDALLPETYSLLMGEKPADSVFTNPPSDALDDSFRELFVNLKNACTLGTIQIVCDWRHLQDLLRAAERAEAELTDLRIWIGNGAKQSFLQGNSFQLLFAFQNVANKLKKKVQLKPCHRTPRNGHPPKKDGTTNTDAPHFGSSETTVAMAAEAITSCTARGQNVLDPFLGNGTTLIAAEQVGRICCGIDVDPGCVDMSIRRWQQATGETAVHANSNRSFGDLEEVRHGEKR
jgi:DNA modification methylase